MSREYVSFVVMISCAVSGITRAQTPAKERSDLRTPHAILETSAFMILTEGSIAAMFRRAIPAKLRHVCATQVTRTLRYNPVTDGLRLPQQLFQTHRLVGLFVAVFDDHRSI